MTAVRTIGIMTGNSLDGVDIVLTGFENGRITDLGGFSKPYPRSLTEKMLRLRARIREEGGRMERLVEDGFSLEAINEYTSLVAETVNTFLQRSGYRREDIAALGFLELGAQLPSPEWGAMLGDSLELIYVAPWTVLLPGTAILISVLLVNLLGTGLQRAINAGVE